MIKKASKPASGTSFFDTTITTSVGRLIELFPNSYSRNMGKNKLLFYT